MSDSGNTLNSAEVDFLLDGAGADPSEKSPGTDHPEGQPDQAVTMRGDLEQINLSDIFQTLAMTKMEGVLRVRNPLEVRQVYCNDGYVRILVPARVATRRLGQRLVQAGLLQPEQLRSALVGQRKEHKPLGQLLVEAGTLTQDQIDEIAGMQVAEDLFALFTWRHGTFEFWKGSVEDADLRAQFESCPEFEVSSLLLEVARRSDEWESILAAISSLDEVPQRVGEAPEDQDLGDAGRALFYGADGHTSWRALAEHTTLGLFEVSRVARDLVRQGLLANVGDRHLVEVASVEASSGRPKQALMLLQTLRDRPGERDYEIVRAMADVLVTANERRFAGTLLLEVAQLQADPKQALALARQARDLAPNDAETVSFLRTTLIAHGAPDAAELERCTVELLDALIDADRLDNAQEIVADARATGTLSPQVLVREARVHQKRHDPAAATAALLELADLYRAQNDRQRTIEAYESILRIDRSRKDVLKLLRALKRTRMGRILRVVGGTMCALMLAATGVVYWQQRSFDSAVQDAGVEIGSLLRKGDRAAAREALAHWSDVLGECDQTEDLKQKVEFADAAERTRLQKLAEKRMRERLQHAAELLGSGDLPGALDVYLDLYHLPDYRTEVASVVGARLEALLTEIEQTGRTMHNRLPPEPSELLERRELTTRLADLQSICPANLPKLTADLQKLLAADRLPEWLPKDLRERCSTVLSGNADTFARAATLVQAYSTAVQRNSTERRLDPLFKRAVELEAAFEFAQALALYRQLESEPAGDAVLHAHFREHIERNEAIVRQLEELAAANQAGDGVVALQRYHALLAAFPEVPFARIAQLPLHLESLPPGATVTCGDTEVGSTPCTLSRHPAETKRIVVAKSGFEPESFELTGERTGTTQLVLRLVPTMTIRHDSLVEVAPDASDADRIYLADRAGNVSALATSDGHSLWTFRSRDLSGLLTAPLRHGTQLLVGSLDGDLRALDCRTGDPCWSIPELPTEVKPALVGNSLVLVTTDRQLVVVDVERHVVTARAKLDADCRIDPVVMGSMIVVSGGTGQLTSFRLPDLTQVWQHQGKGLGDSAAIRSGDSLVLSDDRGHLEVLDLKSGTTRWSRACDVESFGPASVVGDSVWLATPQRVLRFAMADGHDLPGISADSEPWNGSTIELGGTLFVPCRDGSLHAFAADSRTLRCRLEAAKRATRTFVVDGSLFVCLPDRRVLWFRKLPS